MRRNTIGYPAGGDTAWPRRSGQVPQAGTDLGTRSSPAALAPSLPSPRLMALSGTSTLPNRTLMDGAVLLEQMLWRRRVTTRPPTV